MTTPHVEYLAHHWIVLAVPAFFPAVVVVGVILFVAMRDRRAGRDTPDNSRRPSDTVDEQHD